VDDVHGELGNAVPLGENSEMVFAHHPLGFESQRMQRALRRHQSRFFVGNRHRFLRM
jgi:hypothetical protein